jgi:hypothetical protein
MTNPANGTASALSAYFSCHALFRLSRDVPSAV